MNTKIFPQMDVDVAIRFSSQLHELAWNRAKVQGSAFDLSFLRSRGIDGGEEHPTPMVRCYRPLGGRTRQPYQIADGRVVDRPRDDEGGRAADMGGEGIVPLR